MKRVLLAFFSIVIMACSVKNGFPQNQPTVKEIFRKVLKHWDPINDYTVDSQIIVDIPGIRMPKMRVKIYFKKPDKVYLKARGFAIFPKNAMGPDPRRLQKWEKNARFAGMDTLRGHPVYHVIVEANQPGVPLYQVHLYLSTKTFLIEKIKTVYSNRRFMSLKFRYKKLKKTIWVPKEIVASFELRSTKMDSIMNKFQPNRTGGSRIFKMPFKKGTVYIYLKNYKLNTGLKDSIFEKKK